VDELDGGNISLRDLLDALPVPVIVYGIDGTVLLANRARKDFAGEVASLSDAIARTHPVSEEGEPVPRDELPAVRALRGETVLGERLRLHGADGHSEVLLVNATPLRDRNGAITSAVVVFHDITAISDLERGRRELFAMTNHDLRTPLTVILGFAQLAKKAIGRDPDRAQRTLDDIERQTRRMIRLVQDLLDVARFESGVIPVVPEPGDLAARVRDAVARQPSAERFTVTIPDEAMPAFFDPDRVDQILDNLLSNAIRHTQPGTAVEVRLVREGSELVLRVIDRGGGIAADERARLFRPFYQTPRGRQYGGTGLGLHISRRIAEAHRGRLWLESTGPDGSTFAFALPAI